MKRFASLRGGRRRFVVESKLFEIEVEESGGKLKGCIWERSRGFESWIRFGEASLRCLLEGVETCCREVDDQRWAIEWLEGNRKFRMERRLNKAGRFILCSVRDMEAKRYSIIFPEGKGQASGWNSLAVRLRGLGVTPTEGLKIPMCQSPVKPKGVLKVQWKEKGVEMKSFAEAVKSSPRRAVPLPELDFVRNWPARIGRIHCPETWVRVVGLPLHFWSLEVFKSIGDGCGGFIAVDEGTKSMSELQWARILVKRVDWEVPSSVHIALGTGCFALHLWWESAPWFSQVVPAGSSSGKGGLRAGEEVDGPLRVACCGSQRKGVEQLGLQVEVQDVACNGGKTLFPLLKPLDGTLGFDRWAFDGNETPSSLPRAQFLQSIPISRGASQDARGEVDPLVGLPRDSMTRVSSQMMDRGFLTDEALCEEASSNGVLASEGEKSGWRRTGGEFEGMFQDLDGCRWDDSYLARFSNFLGFSTDKFEGEILNLLLRTKRREQNLKKGTSGTTKFDRELKKLEWSINYTRARKENSVVREGGEGYQGPNQDRKRWIWCACKRPKSKKCPKGYSQSWRGKILRLGSCECKRGSWRGGGFLDKRVLEVYGPTMKRYREPFWEELGAIRGLWSDPWCIGGDFNVIRFPSEWSRVGRLSGPMRRFSEVLDELALRDLPFQGVLYVEWGVKWANPGRDWIAS
ncbi:hypothetical protein CK203_081002 [Vitis vinifera]|uniref:Uncharacterized protein n=1 Tax=Vitis vinifera TaxID=29760 RepID=A0A438EMW3_VITVI|nr:hypothetical protein CK203_081002 [Vitis vinifera]